MSAANLAKLLQPALKALEKDLLTRTKTARVEAGLRAAWAQEQRAGQTGLGFEPWRRERAAQLAVGWVLSVVFVRTLEDRGYIDPRVAGATAEALRSAEDREALLLQIAPFLGPREYLLAVFRELSRLPGARDVFDARHNPVWALAPSSEGAKALLDFFRRRDASGAPLLGFAGEDTRFLGDLYQDLSETVRKRYALLQTPEFVEKFILAQTLDPAIAEFGLAQVRLIDPTCGSGHFLLGAFRCLLGRWQAAAPTEHIADHARRALSQVYGIDLNPYAAAIARFRLVLAVLDAVDLKRLERAPDIRPNVVVADSLLHRFDQRVLSVDPMSVDDDLRWGDRLLRLESRSAVEPVLTRRFHAVVGNPPYITEKDGAKRKEYRDLYESAAGKYALAAPFTERFFDLAVEGGFVGMINSNAWTKRDYGRALIEKVLPRLDVQKIIDTSGCYLPGHGTPTLLLFGRNRRPGAGDIVAVLGKRGEQEVPADPASAPVWSEIVLHHGQTGYDGEFISTESMSAEELRAHPWITAGGGARSLLQRLRASAGANLAQRGGGVGVLAVSGEDAAFVFPKHVLRRHGVTQTKPYAGGDDIRDWAIAETSTVAWMYGADHRAQALDGTAPLVRLLWPARTTLSQRKRFSVPVVQRGMKWYELQEFYPAKLATPHLLAFGEVATHNHFVFDSRGLICGRPAPVLKLRPSEGPDAYRSLLGYLNSSTAGFLGRIVFFQKGGDQAGDGARMSATPWQRHLQMAGKLLEQFPVPALDDLRDALLDLVIAAEAAVRAMAEQAPDQVVPATLAATPALAALREARIRCLTERARLRGILVSLQEEMDWRVYGLFGLPTVTAPSVEAVRVPVAPSHRPFEVRLAREVHGDISASEWFRVHKRQAPQDVGGPLAALYRQRLRLLDDPEHGKPLRLLETPETKRRWPPPDDAAAFTDAVRTWLLGRIETAFGEHATPELRTARQLAGALGRDPAVQAAHELLTEESGLDLVRLLSDLVDGAGVPFLAGYRYSETGMEKRAGWEETWRLQRLEDAGALAPELKRLNLRAIPVPDKYGPKDFLRHYWGLRGKLEVPKERFITVPGGNTDEDTTPLVGWAGWDHLQAAQALWGLYQRRKSEDGWTKERLVPLLAGIEERVPWLLQWHNEPSAAFGGMRLGEFFREFVDGEAHGLGVAVGDLRTWTPPAAPRRTTIDPSEVLSALKRWTPDAEDDDGEDEGAELPEGPTAAELATAVGVPRALISKALQKLEADGLVEKLRGRPARYLAPGDAA